MKIIPAGDARRPGKKRKNPNAANQQKAIQDNIEKKIKPALKMLGKRRGRPPYTKVTHLAEDLETHTEVDAKTLLRNPKYRAELNAFLISQPGVIVQMDPNNAPPAALKAMLEISQGDIANLSHRLSVVEPRLQNQEQKAEETGDSIARSGDAAADYYNLDANIPFQETAMLLLLVLESLNRNAKQRFGAGKMQDLFVLDIRAKQILDKSQPRENMRVLAGPKRANWFFEWYEKHKDVLGGGEA